MALRWERALYDFRKWYTVSSTIVKHGTTEYVLQGTPVNPHDIRPLPGRVVIPSLAAAQLLHAEEWWNIPSQRHIVSLFRLQSTWSRDPSQLAIRWHALKLPPMSNRSRYKIWAKVVHSTIRRSPASISLVDGNVI